MKVDKKDENAFTRQVIEAAHLYKWRVAHFRPAMNRDGSWNTPVQADGAGFTDLVMVRDDAVMAIELKMKDNEPSDNQIKWMLAFNAAGVYSEVWRPSDWNRLLNLLVNGPPKQKLRDDHAHNNLPAYLR